VVTARGRKEDSVGRAGGNHFICIPVRWGIGQGSIKCWIPICKGMDMILSGPLATEVNLKIVDIQLFEQAILNAVGHSKELLVIDNMKLRC